MQEISKDDRTWAMFCHLAAIVGLVVPFGHIIGPLVVWLLKRDQSAFVDDQGKESVNFQITFTIYMIISGILILLLVGIALLAILPIVCVIFVIIAAIRSNEGVWYRYPLTIRLIK
jgi:uncharacterized protein